MGVKLWANHMGENLDVIGIPWGTSWELGEPSENLIGTLREYHGNTLEITKIK
jgi:hypothetical protein